MTHRLLDLAAANWAPFDGWLASRRVDPLALPLDRLCSLIYHWATREGDEQGIQKFEMRLYRPPLGVVPTVGPWAAEAETSAFKSLKAQLNIQDPVAATKAGDGLPPG